MILNCYIDERTRHILERVSAATGRSVEELAESAIAEAALREAPPPPYEGPPLPLPVGTSGAFKSRRHGGMGQEA